MLKTSLFLWGCHISSVGIQSVYSKPHWQRNCWRRRRRRRRRRGGGGGGGGGVVIINKTKHRKPVNKSVTHLLEILHHWSSELLYTFLSDESIAKENIISI